ncbi:MAG: sigma-54 dependent transcriptional regulator [Myxococcota bacterium]|nr:sigma-54 dependent transcriptional regulator [Myxococcota bacterium]
MSEILLVIDTQDGLAEEVDAALGTGDQRVLCATTPDQTFAHLDSGWIDLVVCSPDAQGAEGYDLIPQLRRRLPHVAVAFASSADSTELAEQAVARGVCEMLARPVSPAALQLLLQRSQDSQRRQRVNGLLRRELRRAVGDCPIVAASQSMITVLEDVERATQCSTPTLIRGEPGTGKEAIARAIHMQSARHEAPFVALSCAGVAETYIENEVFGRARGDYTHSAPARRGLLAEMRGGTLYLDELGALSPRLQTRLARTLTTREIELPGENRTLEIDLNVLASTQRDLTREAKAGRFDDELLALFDPTTLFVPPLRERREDIPLLADSFLIRLRQNHGRCVRGISDSALEALTRYPWPGNVRELENTLDRATLLADGERIELRDLPDAVQSDHNEMSDDVWALRPARRSAETAAIRRALRATGGNRTHAARLLRISQRALLYKIKDYAIRD